MSGLDFLFLGIIILSLALLGIIKSIHVTYEEDFLLASRKIGLFPLVATLVMTEFNSSTLIAFSSMGYVASLWALMLPAVFFVGLLFYSTTVAKKWKQTDQLSVADFFAKRYSPTFGKFASIALLTAMAGFSAVYIQSMTLLFHPLLPNMPFWCLSLLLVTIVLGMTLRGGLVSIIHTDLGSFILLAIIMPLILFFAWQQNGNHLWSQMNWAEASTALPPWFVFALMILTMFTYILAPWYGQKMVAAKTQKIAMQATAFAAVFVFIFYGCGVLAVASIRNIHLENSDMALPHLLFNFLPSGLRGTAFALLFAAAATTLTGVWNAMTTMTIGDFLGKSNGIQRGRFITLCWAILAYLLSNFLNDQILQQLILANIPIFALSFALIGGFYWSQTTSAAAYTSTVIGISWGVGTYIYFGNEGDYLWYWIIYGLPLIFGSGWLVIKLESSPFIQTFARRSNTAHISGSR